MLCDQTTIIENHFNYNRKNDTIYETESKGERDMLLYDLIEKCSYRDEFQNEHEQCEDCSYGDNCPGDCQKCLQYVHYPQNAPVPRKYDCVHMADCYYCKYAYGDEYKRNCLIFDDIPDEIRKAYNPFDSCASAQILIKKEQKEVIR